MSPATDPYRTLGLSRGASMAEVKAAYRRLAKEHHPDAGGPAALPRFLAIQAAYEQLVHGSGTAAARPGPSRASAADPVRADATRRAYGGRARRARPAGGPGASSGAGPTSGSRGRPTSAPPGTDSKAAGGEPRKRGKATLGSTSYDGADATPFEPDWSGASWYGTTSGTYWTINPKEYADPRKHGPEYQARARRATATQAGRTGSTEAPSADPEGEMVGSRPGEGGEAAGAGAPSQGTSDPTSAPRAGPVDATASWWDVPATDPRPATEASPSRAAPPETPRPATAPPPPAPDLGAAATDLGRALTDERSAHGWWRVAQAVVGWLPIAYGIGWLSGELTGCGRASASCDGADPWFGPITAVVALGLLLLVPRLAALAAAAAIAVAIVVVPAAAILSATSAGEQPPDRGAALGAIVLLAWIAGLVIGVMRRRQVDPSPVGPGGPGGPVS